MHNVKAGITAEANASDSSAVVGKQNSVGRGLCETRRSVLKLNALLFSALLDAGRCATPVHPLDGWQTAAAVLSSACLVPVQRCLQLNILPVLHGDVVFDSVRGYTVLSGDDIVEELASRLRPPFVLFVSDVPGVFLAPPASASEARVCDPTFISLCIVDGQGQIKRLQLSASDSLHTGLSVLEVGGSNGTDITGGTSDCHLCSGFFFPLASD
jgi:isopentenyl phosphate kinase